MRYEPRIDTLLVPAGRLECKSLGKQPKANGATTEHVRCVCGTENGFHVWSWARHGKARCAGCKRWIYYADLSARKRRKPKATKPKEQPDGHA